MILAAKRSETNIGALPNLRYNLKLKSTQGSKSKLAKNDGPAPPNK